MKFIMDFGTNMVTTQDLETDRGQESWSGGIVVWNRDGRNGLTTQSFWSVVTKCLETVRKT